MNKSVLVVYSCYNPPTSLIDSIQSLYDKQIINDVKHKIICIDNNSDIISTCYLYHIIYFCSFFLIVH